MHDLTAPTIEISHNVAPITNNPNIIIAIIFSEKVNGFEPTYIQLDNAIFKNMQTADSYYF